MSCPTRAPARAAALVVLAVFLAGAAGGQDLSASPGEPSEPVVTLGTMTYVATRGDTNEVVLDAEHARVLPEQDVAYLEGVRAQLASEEGDGALDMVCDRGTFELDSGDFIAEGHVRGVTGDGRHFSTDALRYRNDTGLVVTDRAVTIRDAAGTYSGRGFEYHVRENRFRLLGGATVVQGGK
jgi:LPS export ABC transporter protein LptC